MFALKASCSSDDATNYFCKCLAGFAGQNCDKTVACFDGYCENNGTCREVPGNENTCDCQDGYSGDRCQTENDCAKQPCLNGGKPEDDIKNLLHYFY
jgi:hypothetical protein